MYVRICIIKVCPPGLHITLGVFQRLFNLLENECHLLDKQIITAISSTRESTFEQYMQAKVSQSEFEQEKITLTSKINIAQQYLVLQLLTTPEPLQNQTVISTSEYIKTNTNRITEIVWKILLLML